MCVASSGRSGILLGSYPSGQLGKLFRAKPDPSRAIGAALALKSLAPGGDNHTASDHRRRTAVVLGQHTFGQLGDCKKSNAGQREPSTVTGGLKFTALALGRTHTCGLIADGSAYCWGSNAQGQLGDGTVEERLAPVRAAPTLKFASLTAGDSQTCGVTSDGTAHCWGSNAFGQLGSGTSGGQQTAAVAVAGGVKFATVTGGEELRVAWHERACTVGSNVSVD